MSLKVKSNKGYINPELFMKSYDYDMIFKFIYSCCNTNKDYSIQFHNTHLKLRDFEEFYNVSRNIKTSVNKYLTDNKLIYFSDGKYYVNKKYFSHKKNKKCNFAILRDETISLFNSVSPRLHKKIGRIYKLSLYADGNIIKYHSVNEISLIMGYSNSDKNNVIRLINSVDYKFSNGEKIITKENKKIIINKKFIETLDTRITDFNGELTEQDVDTRNSYKYKEWRDNVINRDKKCIICERDDITLEAHHILPYHKYKDLRTDVDNGITLCECHHSPMILGGFHQVYGTINNTKEQLQDYITSKRISLNLPDKKIDDIIFCD